jgi:hypothetical protein
MGGSEARFRFVDRSSFLLLPSGRVFHLFASVAFLSSLVPTLMYGWTLTDEPTLNLATSLT